MTLREKVEKYLRANPATSRKQANTAFRRVLSNATWYGAREAAGLKGPRVPRTKTVPATSRAVRRYNDAVDDLARAAAVAITFGVSEIHVEGGTLRIRATVEQAIPLGRKAVR